MICVECKSKVPIENTKKIHCLKCNYKIDKYSQTSLTLQYIDCLLLKPQIYAHFLVNCRISNSRLFSTMLLQLLCILIGHLTYISNVEIPLLSQYAIMFDFRFQFPYFVTYLILNCVIFRHIGIKNVIFILLFSSFFNLFKILFAIWKYDIIFPYFILEILNLCSNVVAMKCFIPSHMKIFVHILVSKAFSFCIVSFFLSKKGFLICKIN